MILVQHKFKLLALFLLLVLAWLMWPVYQFFAYKNDAPMLPVGFVTLPEDDPASQVVTDARYKNTGKKALDALVDHKRTILAPGISAAVAIDGSLVWTGVAGWADIKKALPVTADTRFRIGSTSKALTATALARMTQSGSIDLDKPIGNYLAQLPNPQWQDITPRQLVSHMAGLPEYKKNQDKVGLYHTMALRRHYSNVVDSLEVFDDTPLLFRPGTRFHYSTYNTVLLSAVMAAASNQSYLGLIKEQVVGPLAMNHTEPDPVTPTDTMATFYWRRGNEVKPWRRVDLSHRLAGEVLFPRLRIWSSLAPRG